MAGARLQCGDDVRRRPPISEPNGDVPQPARVASLPDFDVRHGLDRATLVELFAWTEAEFDERHAGSAIRRIGHARWLRNIAVGLGNARSSPDVVAALQSRAGHPDPVVREHVAWALARHAAS